eukprot:jgi/Tetstr1/434020/TSEL_002454.t1
MAMNHTQLKWVIMEIIRRSGTESSPTAGGEAAPPATGQPSAPSQPVATSRSSRPSVSSRESAAQPLPSSVARAFAEELRLHMEILESKRKQEAAERKLQQMRRKRGILEAFTMDEGTRAARSVTKKAFDVTSSAANASIRWAEKAHAHADTAANASATKAAAESAARQTHTAVDKAVTWCQTAADKLHACYEALVVALQTTTYVDSSEEKLRRLEGAALSMQIEEEEDDEGEEEEVVEVQEEGQGGAGVDAPARRRRRPPVDHAIAFEAAQASVDSARQAIATAHLHADRAATSALLAAAREAFCKAAKPKVTRRRGAEAVAPRAPLLDITNSPPTADA